MITSLLVQDDTGVPVVLCKANPRTEAKLAAAYNAAQFAFLHAVYGYQPTKGMIAGFVSNVTMEGSIVAVEVVFRQYDFDFKGMFELPVYLIKFQGKNVSATSDSADWIGQPIVLKIIDRYKLDGFFLSKVAAVKIGGGNKWKRPPRPSVAKLEA